MLHYTHLVVNTISRIVASINGKLPSPIAHAKKHLSNTRCAEDVANISQFFISLVNFWKAITVFLCNIKAYYLKYLVWVTHNHCVVQPYGKSFSYSSSLIRATHPKQIPI